MFLCYELATPAPGMKIKFKLPDGKTEAGFNNKFINELPYTSPMFISEFFLTS